MTKAELTEKIHYACRHRELSKAVVNEVLDYCFEELKKGIKKDGKFTYPGFGTWTIRNRKGRVGRNPQTGEQINIKPYKTVTFRPSTNYKDTL